MQKSLISPGLWQYTFYLQQNVTKSWFTKGSGSSAIKEGDDVNAKASLCFTIIWPEQLPTTNYPFMTLGQLWETLRPNSYSLNLPILCSGFYYCSKGSTEYRFNIHKMLMNYAGINTYYVYGTDDIGDDVSGKIQNGDDIQIGNGAYSFFIIPQGKTL